MISNWEKQFSVKQSSFKIKLIRIRDSKLGFPRKQSLYRVGVKTHFYQVKLKI